MNTFLAASAGMIGWLLFERIKDGKPTTLGAASGAVAGLVAITPCAGFVGGMAPILIGLAAGVLCVFAIQLKFKFGYDDSLDVVGVHLVGGLVGALLLGFFADATINPLVKNEGLFVGGDAKLLWYQFVASAVTLVFSFVVSFIIAKAIDKAIGMRVTEEEENEGLDYSQHAETAYSFGSTGSMDRL
ncbi:MAG: ammonia channel protein, partial [Actinobacteria bacterium]|nr:ammonia channel protein [Actinomycetota bacterium]